MPEGSAAVWAEGRDLLPRFTEARRLHYGRIMRFLTTAHGFSLIEALVAAALLAGTIGGLAHLITRAAEQAGRAERQTIALALAQAKLEQLRSASFRFDASGARVDSAVLGISAADSLWDDVPPYVEALDRFGALLPQGVPTYTRRWSIATAANAPDTLVLAVCVVPATHDRQPDVCVWANRTRQP